MELQYAVQPSLAQRLRPRLQNWRLLLFVAVVATPFIWAGYSFLSSTMTGGIHHYGDYTFVELKPMGNFGFDDQAGRLTDVPREFRELDGKRVKLQGMMYAGMYGGAQVANFELVYNIQKCCFSGPPKVQERVFVHSPGSKLVPYYNQMVDVVGKLHVRIKRNDVGTVESVYDLDLENLNPS